MTAPARILPMLLALEPEERAEVFARLPPAVAAAARYAWRDVWARPDQLAPGTVGAAPARLQHLLGFFKRGGGAAGGGGGGDDGGDGVVVEGGGGGGFCLG